MVIRNLTLFVMLMMFSTLSFGKLTADVDRTVIEEGETFLLTVRSDDASPDLSVLESNFNVLGTSRSSKVSFVNGEVSSEKEWIVTLSPKKTGFSIIPAISAGSESTPPIRIQVVKAKAINAAQGADIFLEVKLDTNTAYVQSEVIYIARLYRAVEIRDGSLTEPEINSAVVERMGEDVTFQTMRNNRRYQVTERRFALFPQKSGSLAIPPTVFDGKVVVPGPGSRSNDPFDRFFQSQQRLRRVQVKSDALALDVLPQPKNYNGDNWLPAKRLVLSESWSVDPPQFKVGEPITRTLRIEAVGQTGAQLPTFKEFPAHGIKQYVDQPKVETGLLDGSLVGIREEKFAIIPTTSGKLVLPEIRLYWWDTEMDKERTAVIPPKIIDVAPADVVTGSTVPEPEQPPQLEMEQTTLADNISDLQSVENAGYWPWLALTFGIGWLLTIFAWIRQVRKNKLPTKSREISTEIDEKSLKEAKNRLKQACKANDANQAKLALLAWAEAAWPESKTRSLLSVGERLHDSTVIQAVIDLDEVLYSNVGNQWDGDKFWHDVGQRLKKPRQKPSGRLKSLPALYPQ